MPDTPSHSTTSLQSIVKMSPVNTIGLFIFVCTLYALLRWPLFLYYSVDYDETLYDLIALELQRGFLPHTTVIDNKPPGWYFLYALQQLVIPDVASARRVGTVISLAAGILLSGSILKRAGTQSPFIIASILSYGFISLFPPGWPSNTAPVQIMFIMAATWLIFRSYQASSLRLRDALIIGLCFGLAFQVKLSAIFIEVILGSGALFLMFRLRLGFTAILKRMGLMILGFIAPTLLIAIIYGISGEFDTFVYGMWGVHTTYVSHYTYPASLIDRMLVSPHIWFLFGTFLAASLILLLLRLRISMAEKIAALLFAGLYIGGFIEIFAQGKGYGHHFFVLYLPLIAMVTLAASAIGRTVQAHTNSRTYPSYLVLSVASIIPFLALGLYGVRGVLNEYGNFERIDHGYATAAAAIKSVSETDNPTLFVWDANPILHTLTNAKLVTNVIFPDHWFSQSTAFGVDTLIELRKALSNQPQFIVVGRMTTSSNFSPACSLQQNLDISGICSILAQHIDTNYTLIQRIPVGKYTNQLLDIYVRSSQHSTDL